MSNRSSQVWPVIAAIVGLVVFLIALPSQWKGWAPRFLRTPSLHLGLDLAGGTQLDFRISEQEINAQLAVLQRELDTLQAQGAEQGAIGTLQSEINTIKQQKENLLEAVRTVLERRINGLGVSEATITPSYVGGEQHLLVECPGVIDVQKCIETVGKTIQLEFKEEFTQATADYKAEVAEKVAAAERRMTRSGTSLLALGQDLSDELGIHFLANRTIFKSELPKGLEELWNTAPGKVIKRNGILRKPVITPQGEATVVDDPGIYLAEVAGPKTSSGRIINEASVAFGILEKEQRNLRSSYHEDVALPGNLSAEAVSALRSMKPGELRVAKTGTEAASIVFLRNFTPGQEQVGVSHILVAYKGALSADKSVTRSKAEALMRAAELKAELDQGKSFATLARTQSDGPSRAKAGNLGTIMKGSMVPEFESVAFQSPVGKVSAPTETPFGYHLIRVDRAPSRGADLASYDELAIRGKDAEERGGQLIAKLTNGEVQTKEEALPIRFVFFSETPTGWKDTALDGKHFRSAAVTTDPLTAAPVVQIMFDEEGGRIFGELTARNVGKSIAIFVGGTMVTQPTVQQAITSGTAVITGSRTIEEAQRLAQDLNTGAIPAPIYLAGQRTVEATLGQEAMHSSVVAGLIGLFVLFIYMLFFYRLLGVVAYMALGVYAVLFLTIAKLPVLLFTNQYIVLTLAGIAGAILSIGMAIDSNILIYERLKEELRKGRKLSTAVEGSFQYAWPAIRDVSVSTLITSAILFTIGTSIVKGFALTLAMGVLMSLFTAITVTRWILRFIIRQPWAQNTKLYGVNLPAQSPDHV